MTKSLFAALFIVSGVSHAETRTYVCSSASGAVSISGYDTEVKENASLNKEVVTLKTRGLMGPGEVVLQMKDLNFSVGRLQIIETSQSSSDTICKVKQKAVHTKFVQEITFSKKDGSNILQDDTPDTVVRTVKEIVLCSKTVVDSWPCN